MGAADHAEPRFSQPHEALAVAARGGAGGEEALVLPDVSCLALQEVPYRIAVGIVARPAGKLDHGATPERAEQQIAQDRQVRDPRRQRVLGR